MSLKSINIDGVSLDAVLKEIHGCAKKSAIDFISSQFKSQSDLENLEFVRGKLLNNKTREETKLKSDLASHFERISVETKAMDSAFKECEDIHSEMTSIRNEMTKFLNLRKEIDDLTRYSVEYSCISKSINLLDKLFDMPEVIEKSKKMIDSDEVLQAHINLLELEQIRDQLYLQHLKVSSRYTKNSPDSDIGVVSISKYFTDLNTLNNHLVKWVTEIVSNCLDNLKSPVHLTCALRILMREEFLDDYWNKRVLPSGMNLRELIGRPKKVKELAFSGLQERTFSKLSILSTEFDNKNLKFVSKLLERVRQTMEKDLNVVKTHLYRCFPPQMNISYLFLTLYHAEVSKLITELCNLPLEIFSKQLPDDPSSVNLACLSLLLWNKKYFVPDEIIGRYLEDEATFEIFCKKNVLIPVSKIREIEDCFIQSSLKMNDQYISRMIPAELDKWCSDSVRPDTIELENGRKQIVPNVSLLVFRMLNPNLLGSIQISQEIQFQVLFACLTTLHKLLQRFTKQYQYYQEVHFKHHELASMSSDLLKNHLTVHTNSHSNSLSSSALALTGILTTKATSNADLNSIDSYLVSIPQMLAKISSEFSGWPHFLENSMSLANSCVDIIENTEKFNTLVETNKMTSVQIDRYTVDVETTRSLCHTTINMCLLSIIKDFLREASPAFEKLYSKFWINNPSVWMNSLLSALEGFSQIVQQLHTSLQQLIFTTLDRSLAVVLVKNFFKSKMKFSSEEEKQTIMKQFGGDVENLASWFQRLLKIEKPEMTFCYAMFYCCRIYRTQPSSFAQPDLNRLGSIHSDFNSKHVHQLLNLRSDVSAAAAADMVADFEKFKTTDKKECKSGLFSEISEKSDSNALAGIFSKTFNL